MGNGQTRERKACRLTAGNPRKSREKRVSTLKDCLFTTKHADKIEPRHFVDDIPFRWGSCLSVQELHLQKEKVRVYALARELNIESKDLLDMCRQAGIDVKNQLSSLDPDQRDLVEQMVRRGGSPVAVAAPPKPATPVIPTLPTPVPTLASRPVRREPDSQKTPPPKVSEPPPPVSDAPPGAPAEAGPKAPPVAPAARHADATPVAHLAPGLPAKPVESTPVLTSAKVRTGAFQPTRRIFSSCRRKVSVRISGAALSRQKARCSSARISLRSSSGSRHGGFGTA